jgi:hypothetical protein
MTREHERIKTAEPYSPNVMLFFKTISWLEHDRFQAQMLDVDKPFAIQAFASQVYHLSGRVYRKHVLVNIGFALAGASLILFLAVAVSYLTTFAQISSPPPVVTASGPSAPGK